MDWIINLFTATDSVAHIILLYASVIFVGVMLGRIKVFGINLGVTFVLFAGILAGHLHFTGPQPVLTFMQDFGLVLFVFCIGLQVGPGFFESFRAGGVRMNILTTCMVLLNIAVMFGCYYLFFDTTTTQHLPMLIGTLYGAVTNTPGLGAANEALGAFFPNGNAPDIASAYACAYPLAVVGIILSMIAIRYICKVSYQAEEQQLADAEAANPHEKPHQMILRVQNEFIAGRTLMEVNEFLKRDVVCTRILHDGQISIPNRDTQLHIGDEVLIVCAEADAEPIQTFIGPRLEKEWEHVDENMPMVSRRLVVTSQKINGKTLAKMHFSSVYGVNITRITRHGIELFASRNHHFHVGDRVMVVGPEDNVQRVAELFGDSQQRLNHPNIATIFIGIFVGLIFGSIPFAIPGLPVPLKLGLAGGPLIIAILIGRYGHLLKLVNYTTTSANLMLRETGLALFLASVGIKAGASFWNTVVAGDGIKFVYCGFLITVIPILLVGTFARLKYKINYFTLMGMIAGSYTDPPALAFANGECSKQAPAVGYSTVYPLAMFLRIFTAQLMVLAC